MSRIEIVQSEKNSTAVPLAADGLWEGEAEDLSSFQEIDINVAGAPGVAPGVLTFEFSPDGLNWDISVDVPLAGPSMVPLPLRVILPKFRVKYQNGAVAIDELRLTTIYHRSNSKNLTRFLSQPLSADTPIEAVRAVIAAKKPDGSFINLELTADGEMPVSADSSPGVLTNGEEVVVDDTIGGVEILAANPARKAVVIQNVGDETVRVGVVGVTANSGMKLMAGATLVLEVPHCPVTALHAIRAGAVDGLVCASEIE